MGGGATFTFQNCEVIPALDGTPDISFDDGSVLANPSDNSNQSFSFSSCSISEFDPDEDGPYINFGSDITFFSEIVEIDGPYPNGDGWEIDFNPRTQDAATKNGGEPKKRREVKDRLFTLTKVKWQSLSLKDLECADRQLEKALKNYEGKLEKEAKIQRFIKEVNDTKVGKSE